MTQRRIYHRPINKHSLHHAWPAIGTPTRKPSDNASHRMAGEGSAIDRWPAPEAGPGHSSGVPQHQEVFASRKGHPTGGWAMLSFFVSLGAYGFAGGVDDGARSLVFSEKNGSPSRFKCSSKRWRNSLRISWLAGSPARFFSSSGSFFKS